MTPSELRKEGTSTEYSIPSSLRSASSSVSRSTSSVPLEPTSSTAVESEVGSDGLCCALLLGLHTFLWRFQSYEIATTPSAQVDSEYGTTLTRRWHSLLQ